MWTMTLTDGLCIISGSADTLDHYGEERAELQGKGFSSFLFQFI